MGVVYRAYDCELGHDVALKSLNHIDPDQVYQLKSEFRLLADIRHPNLVDLYELFASERGCFFTMELVAGCDLVTYVRIGGECDFGKLSDAARQLAIAVSAVHAARKLHRDIKPSNVMVTNAGRVVLLDFGLVAPLVHDAERTTVVGSLVGTPGYMPPEQARGEALTPAADWYSFGSTLFEAATGQLPLERPLRVLSRSQTPRRIRDIESAAPAELDDLVARLLDPVPARRPLGADVLKALSCVPSPEAARAPASRIPARHTPFQGRIAEMAALESALTKAKAGQGTTAHLHGPSGIGKTELGRRFTEHAERNGALVLRGRCHPLESIVFNAVDGMVDQLSQVLDRASPDELSDVLPSDSDALARLFPVLGRLEAISEALQAWSPDEPGFETLRRGTRALKELLHKLGRKRPIVIWLDDVQWGDEDSGRLLRELIRPPGEPTLLLVLSYRTEDRAGSRTLSALRPEHGKDTGSVVDIPLAPLSETETLSLVSQLLGDGDFARSQDLASLAREAQGIPFFALEVARCLSEASQAELLSSSHLGLGGMLDQRMLRLPSAARRVLEVVSVSGGPLERRFVLRAAGLDESARPMLSDLERRCLIRSTTVTEGRPTEVYHHRIRDAVLALLDDDARREHHRAIADAMLTATAPNLPRVVEHYDAAGDTEATRRYVVSAARQAAHGLAFDRAAGLYRRAIDLGSTELAPAELHERLGGALANAGRGREAGLTFERAATYSEKAGAPSDYSLSLRKRAAEQYLKSWQRDDAARTLRAVMGPLRIKMPSSAGAAIRDTVINRACIALLGFGSSPRRNVVALPSVQDRLEVLQVLMQVYGMMEHTHSFVFGSRLLREALEVGDSHLLMRGLACECVAWAALDNRLSQRQADRHVAEMKRVSGDRGSAYDSAIIDQCLGIAHHFRGEFRLAASELERAAAGLRQVGAGVTVDVATNISFRLAALWFLGRLREQSQLLDAALADAQARGDDYLVATCAAGHSSLAWLVSGRASETRDWAGRVLSLAPPGFSSQHYLHLIATAAADLYEGRGIRASAQMEAAWPFIQKNHFLTLSNIGDDLRQTRARAAIAAAAELTKDRGPTKRAADLLRTALKEAHRIDRSSLPFARGWGELLRAGVAAVRGDRHDAARALDRGASIVAAHGMSFYAAGARWALGTFCPTAAAARLEGEAWMSENGVQDSRSAARMLVPGCVL